MSLITDAIIDALYAESDVTDLLGDPQFGIGFIQVEPDVNPDWIIVVDAGGNPEYNFGNNEAYSTDLYAIKAICKLGGTSAASRAESMMDAVYDTLHDVDIDIEGRIPLSLRRGRSLPSFIETLSKDERYLHMGHIWEIVSEAE